MFIKKLNFQQNTTTSGSCLVPLRDSVSHVYLSSYYRPNSCLVATEHSFKSRTSRLYTRVTESMVKFEFPLRRGKNVTISITDRVRQSAGAREHCSKAASHFVGRREMEKKGKRVGRKKVMANRAKKQKKFQKEI